ncbi:hypothetical protein, partial [Mycobacterium innocens]|uniref:hypothetical protein n=1 Tax=Mycobacterium innocens TaxID=2341083 RepID=UPI000A79C501
MLALARFPVGSAQWLGSVGHRHRDDRPDIRRLPLPARTPLVVTMPPQTKRLPILIQSDAINPIPSARQ